MIWLAWRQHRSQFAILAAITTVSAAALLLAGRGIAKAFETSGLASCFAAGGACSEAAASFLAPYDGLRFLIPLFLVLPVVLGMLWGAPLVAREIELGTHRLAWTQGVSRTRWVLTRIGAVIAGSGLLVGGLTIAAARWSGPILRASDDRFTPGSFDLLGVVPIGYVIFAVALGVAIGTLVRRTMPAVGLTLLGYAAVRAAVALFARPHFMTPKSMVTPFSDTGPRAGLQDWAVSVTSVDRMGNVVGEGLSLNVNQLSTSCPELGTSGGPLPDFSAVEACIRDAGIQLHTVYHPGSRYWAFQWMELGIFVALAVGLIALTVLVIRHRSA